MLAEFLLQFNENDEYDSPDDQSSESDYVSVFVQLVLACSSFLRFYNYVVEVFQSGKVFFFFFLQEPVNVPRRRRVGEGSDAEDDFSTEGSFSDSEVYNQKPPRTRVRS